uniref:Ankyrin repeat protein n=1 Tax=Mycena chlorophos TaxID=658473 RepID=A0ABQ0LR22_MYCCL|nr:ankyrin repeat protein [Mycena chlorophos]
MKSVDTLATFANPGTASALRRSSQSLSAHSLKSIKHILADAAPTPRVPHECSSCLSPSPRRPLYPPALYLVMSLQSTSTPIYGGTGGAGGQGGQEGGPGGIGQGNTVRIKTESVQVYYAQPDDYHKIMDFLSPIKFLQRQQEIFQVRKDGTGNWFLEDARFLEWKSSSKSARILWCPGIPGSGKTVLSSPVYDHLRASQTPGTAVACAFLNYKESNTQTPGNILGAIVQQMAQDNNDFKPLQILYQKHLKQRTPITLQELRGLLKQYAQQFNQVYIIIDALDEYASHKEDLLQAIMTSADNIRLLVTCRPHILPPHTLESAKVDIHPPDDDIKAYIISQVNQSRRLHKFAQEEALKMEMIESLTSKAAGMFLFVKLQMDLLSSALTKKSLLQILSSLPTDLGSLYTQTLERIKLEKSELAEIGILALGWVAFAMRPLTWLELRGALAMPYTSPLMPDESSMIDVEDLLEACHGLLIESKPWKSGYQPEPLTGLWLAVAGDLDHIVKQLLQDPKQAAIAEDTITVAAYHGHVSILAILKEAAISVTHIILNRALKIAAAQGHLSTVRFLVAWKSNGPVRELQFHGSETMYTKSLAIRIAAQQGYKDIVQDLLETVTHHTHSVIRELYGLALHAAAWRGYHDIVQLLINANTDLNIVNGDFGTALQVAVHEGHYDTVELLLNAKADPDVRGGDFGTALYAAVIGRRANIVQLLLNANADPNIVSGFEGTPLQAAASVGDRTIVKLLLDANADPNIIGTQTASTLYTAIYSENYGIIELLLKAKTDLDVIGGFHGTALQVAAYKGSYVTVKLLLNANADPNIVGGYHETALQAAAEEGSQSIVELILNARADPNIIGGKYGTPLQAAAYKGHQTIVELLLNAKADPNLVGGYYGTALQAACHAESQNIVELLLNVKADPNLVGGHYGTALQAAVYKGHQHIIKLLLNAKADPHIVGGFYRNTLQAAACVGHLDIVELLLTLKVDPNTFGGSYETALWAAVIGSCTWTDSRLPVIVQLLLNANADPNVIGYHSETMLYEAVCAGHC